MPHYRKDTVIYVVERHPLYSASIETLMRNAGAVDFCYTPLVRLECLVMPSPAL